MPSRKQRRKRAKDRRHEWEYVYVDETGEEVEAPEEALISRNGKRTPEQRAKPRGGMREVQPPSWRRVGKRGWLLMASGGRYAHLFGLQAKGYVS